MNLKTPPWKVGKLRTALHTKAKAEPEYRFDALYDKMYRKDVLGYAYECCKANQGAAGVDDQMLEDIEASGKPPIALAVDEGVVTSPGAGCGKSACPVR